MPDTPKKLLMLVDGHAVLHRAWHALPPLTDRQGRVVSGAYGFTSTLLKAVRDIRPTHVAVAFDLKGPTFRHEQYEAYKATREKKPEELYAQVPYIREILAAMGVPAISAQGFEADDVIGTVAAKAEKSDPHVETVILTGDLDTLQLVDGRTRVYTMRKGMTDMVIYDEAAVRDRFGLKPTQMVDYKALRGDPSDNIPGVRGIGEKTGAKLIAAFGSLDRLYAAVDSGAAHPALKSGTVEKLKSGRKDAMEARELCRVRLDVPIEFHLKKAEFHLPSREKVAPIFEEFQFASLLKQLPDGGGVVEMGKGKEGDGERGTRDEAGSGGMEEGGTSAQAQSRAVAVKTVSEPAELLKALAKMTKAKSFAFRSAVEGEENKLAAIGISCGSKNTVLLPSAWATAEARRALAELLSDAGRTKYCHDLKREINVLAGVGFNLGAPYLDLMIAAYLFFSGERRVGLDSLISFYRNISVDGDGAARLAAEIPHISALGHELAASLKKYGLTKLMRDIELPLAPVLARMERLGVAVEVPYLKKLSAEFGTKLERLEKDIHRLGGGEFNINSPRQLEEVLFGKLGLSSVGLKKTAKSKSVSTAASELEKLRGAHAIIGHIIDWRELAKLKSTYVDALPELVRGGRIHASFNQAVTATGRLSSSEPNLQNIPTAETENGRLVRNAFVASPGFVLLGADYSQIELRIAAHIAREKAMIRAFRRGEDIHRATAAEMFGEREADAKRRIAKTINFGILFGMGANRLSESAGIQLEEAREYIARYFSVYRGIADYIEATKARLKRDGYVETLFGRRRFFHNYELMNHREKAEAERQAINMPIQGTEADMMKLAMVRIDDWFDMKFGPTRDESARLLLQVHDELVFEVKEKIADEVAIKVKMMMQEVKKLAVPVVVDLSVGKKWGEMEDWDE
jgi:DNA polymerase-1